MPDSKFTRAIQAGISSFMQGRQMFDRLETNALQRELYEAQKANIRTPEQQAEAAQKQKLWELGETDKYNRKAYEPGGIKEVESKYNTEQAAQGLKFKTENAIVTYGEDPQRPGIPKAPQGYFWNPNKGEFEFDEGYEARIRAAATSKPESTAGPKIGDITKINALIDSWGDGIPPSARSEAAKYIQAGDLGAAQAVSQASIYPIEDTLGRVSHEVEMEARKNIADMMYSGANKEQIDMMLAEMRKNGMASGAIEKGPDFIGMAKAGWGKAKPYILGPDRPEIAGPPEPKKDKSGLIEFGQFGTPFVRRK